MSKRLCALVLLIVAVVLIVSGAEGARKLRVIATIPDLKALTEAVGGDLKGKISIVMYGAAIPLAFVRPWIAIGLYVSVALLWLVPDRRIESRIDR